MPLPSDNGGHAVALLDGTKPRASHLDVLRRYRPDVVAGPESGPLGEPPVLAPLRLLEARAPGLPLGPVDSGAIAVPEPLVAGGPRILLVDGIPSAVDGTLPDGVHLLQLREALEVYF
mgnify:CR=1 FL=1